MATPTPTILIRPRGIDGGIRFWWTASDPGLVDSYVLSCASPPLSYPILSVATNYYEVTGLTNLTSYTFQLVAYKDAVASEPAVFRTIQPGLKPPAPTSATAHLAEVGSATIQWTPYPGVPDPTKTQPTEWYLVASSSSNDSVVHRIGQYNYLSTVTLSNLNPSDSYRFLAYAINDAGYSGGASTNTITIPSTVPGAPTGVVGTPGLNQISVAWIAPSNTGGAPITSYTVKYSSDGTNYTTFGTTFSSSPGIVTGLTGSVNYTFKVFATNTNGNSADSVASSAVAPRMVWNPSRKGTDIGITDAGLGIYQQFGYRQTALTTRLIASGEKVMYSIQPTQIGSSQTMTIGWGTSNMHYNGNANAYDGYPGTDNQSIGVDIDGNFFYNGSVQVSSLATYGTVGDIVDVALHDGVGWWIRVNGGNWNNNPSANPATDTGGLSAEGLTGLYPAANPAGGGRAEGALLLLETPTYTVPSGYTFE